MKVKTNVKMVFTTSSNPPKKEKPNEPKKDK